MPLILGDWFCMQDGRSSFLPELPEDANLIFCHDDMIKEKIITGIEMRFATRKPVKMLIYGDWGVGKTHLMYHIRWWLEQNTEDYPAYPVIIEIGDITKKSRFDDIVRPFLDALGLDFLINLVHLYRGKEPNVAKGLRDKSIASHIAEAFNKILLSSPGQPPVDLVVQSFEYLKGRKVPGQATMGFSQPLDQSQEFYQVLLAIGEMYRTVNDGKRMLFVADEAAKLENVDADEATQYHWVTANKLVFDDQNSSFGFIYTVSGKQEKHLPRAIWDPQIQNRLGKHAYRLDTLATNGVESYLRKLLDAFIDWGKVQNLVDSGTIDSSLYERDAYPFTVDAQARFLDHFNRNLQDAKPRDISQSLDQLAFQAGKKGKRLITADVFDSLEM
ncbi:MAG: hypothetical protein KJZ84_13880 [Bryobacteraceae bacterium]|nr:hypothetical protein [Bryobacteraceae bacterium]